MQRFLVAVLFGATCLAGASGGAARAETAMLEGSWRLVRAEPPLPDAGNDTGAVRFALEPGGSNSFWLSGACNSMSGSMDLESDRPEFPGGAESTAQFCPDERGVFDRAFHRAFFSGKGFVVDGRHLVIEGEAGKLVFERSR